MIKIKWRGLFIAIPVKYILTAAALTPLLLQYFK
ncbi:hypothetical protein B2K_39835 [Paenibacillus mucilaginosus K02]|uniref:Uncharacterized protein n=1 Tax=Paenibacillus mucilaginosus K02 TaxID=997761 RepID=R9UNA3_9BACL|nr:hypothetical protein B2K_39835 [Paenibacillus mucilaginosus K02]